MLITVIYFILFSDNNTLCRILKLPRKWLPQPTFQQPPLKNSKSTFAVIFSLQMMWIMIMSVSFGMACTIKGRLLLRAAQELLMLLTLLISPAKIISLLRYAVVGTM